MSARVTSKPKRGWLLWGLLLILVVGVAWKLKQQFTPHDNSMFSMAPQVKTVAVSRRTLEETYETHGTLELDKQATLKAEASGRVLALGFEEGQSVPMGKVLVRLKQDQQAAGAQQSAYTADALQTMLDVRAREIEKQEAALKAAQSRQQLADFEYSRFQKLQQDDLISSWELEQKRNSVETARADTEVAQRQLAIAKTDLRQSNAAWQAGRADARQQRALLSDANVRAPFSGVVGVKSVNVGDFVDRGDPLLTIVQPGPFKVRFSVPERFSSKLKTGLPVRVMLDGHSYPARVVFVDPAVEPLSRTVVVKAELAPTEGVTLRPGQFVDVSLVLAAHHDTLAIPEEAIDSHGEGNYVYLTRPGRDKLKGKTVVLMQKVTLGERDPGWVEIRDGVTDGDRVVVEGLQKIQDGAPIQEMSEHSSDAPSQRKGH